MKYAARQTDYESIINVQTWLRKKNTGGASRGLPVFPVAVAVSAPT